MLNNKKIKHSLILSLIFLGSFFVLNNVLSEELQKNESPVILDLYQNISENKSKIFINGYIISLTNCQFPVLIYINGDYFGLANISKKDNEYCFFDYESQWIEKMAVFEVVVISRDSKSGLLYSSTPLKITSVRTTKQPSAPILQGLLQNSVFNEKKPIIFGLTTSGTFVNFFINDEYNGKTEIINDTSGTANFSYTPALSLDPGKYKIWAIAENEAGQKSQKSNILDFEITYLNPSPAVSNKEILKEQINKKPVFNNAITENAILSENNINKENLFPPTIKTEKLLENNILKTGDETNKNNNFWLNLVIFIIFIFTITAWLFLLNRELKNNKK